MDLRQNSILRISDQKTMDLINLYQKEECLWNTEIVDYKNRRERNLAAERIAEQLDIPHFTSRYVVIKFKNLRNSYCQELKKIENSIKAGDDPVYQPKVFWFKDMDSFVRPHLQRTRDRLSHKASVKSEPDEAEDITQYSYPEQIFTEETNYIYSDSEEEEDQPLRKRSRNSSTASKKAEESEGELPRLMKEISSQLSALAGQDQDCYASFGKYVSAMLRGMPPPRAMEVQPQIVKLLVAATLKGADKET